MQHPSSPSTEPDQLQHPDSSALRRRAADLRTFASSIERSLVTVLGDVGRVEAWTTNRAQLCERMLARNLHQIHEAADDLRDSALRFCERADELDLSHRADVA